MDEAELLKKVRKLIDDRGLIWHHCARTFYCNGDAGLPDLIVVGTSLIMRELKGDTTRITRGQLAYGDVLARAGVSWGVWRPEDLTSGRIMRELDEISG